MYSTPSPSPQGNHFNFLLCCNSICHLLKKKKKIATNSKANSRAFKAFLKLPPPPPLLNWGCFVCVIVFDLFICWHITSPLPPSFDKRRGKEGRKC